MQRNIQSNIDKLIDFMDFSDPDKFYLVNVIQRRKDNPDLETSERVIRTYTITSIESFHRLFPDIVKMCDMFNARAYMYINRRSFKGTAKAMLKRLADNVVDGQYSGLSRLYLSCASAHSAGDGYWIIDLDFIKKNETEIIVDKDRDNCVSMVCIEIENFINSSCVMPEGHKSCMRLLSKNGIHIITKRFDTRAFEKIKDIVSNCSNKIPYNIDVELKKDASVNIYIP